MFTTVKKSLQVRHSGLGGAVDKGRELPYYPNRYFRRQVVHWMVDNRQKVLHYMGQAIRVAYGVVDPTASHGGPFSYADYLKKAILGGRGRTLEYFDDVASEDKCRQLEDPSGIPD